MLIYATYVIIEKKKESIFYNNSEKILQLRIPSYKLIEKLYEKNNKICF